VRFLLCLIFVLMLAPELPARERDFTQVAREVQEDLEKAHEEKALNKADVDRRRKELTGQINSLKNEIKGERKAIEADENRLEALREKRLELERRIQAHTGHMKELDAIIRDFARDFSGLAERSPYSGEDPGRLRALNAFLDKERVLGIQDIRTLMDLAFKDMTASGQVVKRTGPIVDRQGREVDWESDRHLQGRGGCRLSHPEPCFRPAFGFRFPRVGYTPEPEQVF